MLLKGIVDEDFVNYKHPSMLLMFPLCDFKCEKDCGEEVCHNKQLYNSPNIEIPIDKIINRYKNNPITKAIVLTGLEPFLSWRDVKEFVKEFRKTINDTIVIYTGYNQGEIKEYISVLSDYGNIIIKTGRYIPNDTPHFDSLLGVNLASDNQFAIHCVKKGLNPCGYCSDNFQFWQTEISGSLPNVNYCPMCGRALDKQHYKKGQPKWQL